MLKGLGWGYGSLTPTPCIRTNVHRKSLSLAVSVVLTAHDTVMYNSRHVLVEPEVGIMVLGSETSDHRNRQLSIFVLLPAAHSRL